MIKIHRITDTIQYLDGISVAVFDLDDTLYSEKEYEKSGYNAIAKAFPQIKNCAERMYEVSQKGGNSIDEVLKEEGMFSNETKERCLKIYRFHDPDISLYEGVREMLCQIKEKGIGLGMITDGRPEGQRAKIEALGLENIFDIITITDELGGITYRKPNPAAYIRTKKFFSVSYKEMAYIGDNIKKDFIAPVDLGMRSIHFVNTDGVYYIETPK